MLHNVCGGNFPSDSFMKYPTIYVEVAHCYRARHLSAVRELYITGCEFVCAEKAALFFVLFPGRLRVPVQCIVYRNRMTTRQRAPRWAAGLFVGLSVQKGKILKLDLKFFPGNG